MSIICIGQFSLLQTGIITYNDFGYYYTIVSSLTRNGKNDIFFYDFNTVCPVHLKDKQSQKNIMPYENILHDSITINGGAIRAQDCIIQTILG